MEMRCGMNACCNMHTSKLDKSGSADTVLLTMLTGLTKSKDKEYMVFVKVISIFLRKIKITSS